MRSAPTRHSLALTGRTDRLPVERPQEKVAAATAALAVLGGLDLGWSASRLFATITTPEHACRD
jgi:hypothetical protein